MKVQLNTLEEVERFVKADPEIAKAIRQEFARGFDAGYIKPIENCKEVINLKRGWADQVRGQKLITPEYIQEAVSRAIESDVRALLEDKDFVQETVNNCVHASLSLDEYRMRELISRLLNKMLNDN